MRTKRKIAGANWEFDGTTITVRMPMAWKRRGGRKVNPERAALLSTREQVFSALFDPPAHRRWHRQAQTSRCLRAAGH